MQLLNLKREIDQVAKDKGTHCPWFQKGECSFGKSCTEGNKCIIC